MYEKELEVAVDLAREAGKIMLDYFDSDKSVERKADNSPVTLADKEINSLVIKTVAEVFPEDGVVGEEESSAEYGMGRRWICDPIDGTIPFVWGVPTGMFSLGLSIDGKIVVGVAYDPFQDKLFTAELGKGSLCNDKPLSVSGKADVEGAQIATTANPNRIREASYIKNLIDEKAYVAVQSGCVFKSCLIAQGRLDGYIEYLNSPYDVAAIGLIVSEAGGKITDTRGEELDFSKPFKGSIVSNGHLHEKLVEICQED